MFETNANSRKTGINTIIKIDGKNRFVEFSQAFEIGKIKLAFREYDPSREKGKRLVRQIDCYLSTTDAKYLANLCTTHAFREIGRDNERRRAESNYKYPAPIFESYSGKVDGSHIISRRLTLSMKTAEELRDGRKNTIPFSLMVNEGPGVKTETGAIIPDKNQSKSFQYVAIGLSTAQVIKIGCELERAINIYDTWIATGLLEKKLAEMKDISYKEAGNGQSGNRYNAQQQNQPQPQVQHQQNQPYQTPDNNAANNIPNGQQMQMQNPDGSINGFVANGGAPRGPQASQNPDGSINGYARRWQ